uniref:glycerol-3-phosphate dehydrogenase n=1 Tax=Denticeps clupeoides TaxID=299321 RepID=A0AAY4CVT6_9TELE
SPCRSATLGLSTVSRFRGDLRREGLWKLAKYQPAVDLLPGFPSVRSQKTARAKRDDFSSGTSSRSAELIRGGVRYLQKAITELDYEQVNLKPYIAFPLHPPSPPPTPSPYRWWTRPLQLTTLSMLVVGDWGRNTQSTEPGGDSHHVPWYCPLAAGQCDDARMNLAIALTAARYGAAMANYSEVVHLVERADPVGRGTRVRGTRCGDAVAGQEFDVRAKCVINATGPFTDTLRKMDGRKRPNICQPSAAAHIVLPARCRMNVVDPKKTIARMTATPADVTLYAAPTEEDTGLILGEIRCHHRPIVEGENVMHHGDYRYLHLWLELHTLDELIKYKYTNAIYIYIYIYFFFFFFSLDLQIAYKVQAADKNKWPDPAVV